MAITDIDPRASPDGVSGSRAADLRPWLKQYDPGVPAAIDYPSLTLDGLLRRTAGTYPATAALVFFGRRTSYRSLDARVDRLAAGLRRLGLLPGERVALFMPNCPQLVTAFFAVWRAGCIAVPVNPRAAGPELSRQIADAGATAAIVLDRSWRPLAGVTRTEALRHLVVADIADDLPPLLGLGERVRGLGAPQAVAAAPVQTTALRDLLGAGSPRVEAPPRDLDEPAVLLYTGGTTGLPKAAVLTHRNLVADACQLGAWASTLDDGAEIMLSALPLVHGYAMTACMNVSVLRGWTQVLVPDPRDLPRLLDEIERHRVTVFPGVPTLYAAICADRGVTEGRRDLSSIEVCISGAADLPEGVQHEFERLTGGRLVEGYGLSEASPATHCNPFRTAGEGQTIGLPLPDVDCRLVDVETESRPVGPGEPGVLCISGPQVMAGYWGRPEETACALRRDETGRTWLHTGDIAVMSPTGYFRIVDRKKDVIIAAGGLKVYPTEIEDVLSTHPKVHEVAVIGTPPGGEDQRAKAFVVLRAGERADPGELLAFLGERLASYKVPRAIEFRTALPLAFTGKVLRRVLAEEERAASAHPKEQEELVSR